MFFNGNLVLIFFYVDIVAERMRADGHTTETTTTTEERTTGTNFCIHSIDNGSDIAVFVRLVLLKMICRIQLLQLHLSNMNVIKRT